MTLGSCTITPPAKPVVYSHFMGYDTSPACPRLGLSRRDAQQIWLWLTAWTPQTNVGDMNEQLTEHAQARRLAILDAAARVFTAEGYHGATMRAIAREAGLGTGTLYLYFSSKEAVFLALVTRLEELVLDAIVAARADREDTLGKLAASMEAALRVFSANADLARIVLILAAGAAPEFEARLTAIHQAFIRFVQTELDEAVASGLIEPLDTMLAAHIWVGGAYELIMSWLRRADGAAQQAAIPVPAELAADLIAYNFRAIGAPWPLPTQE